MSAYKYSDAGEFTHNTFVYKTQKHTYRAVWKSTTVRSLRAEGEEGEEKGKEGEGGGGEEGGGEEGGDKEGEEEEERE